MRFMSLYRPGRSEDQMGAPTPAEMAAMGKLIEDETKRGTLVSTGGMMKSAFGARIVRKGREVTVVDGPFAETKELVGGYAIMQFASKDEAIEAGKKFVEVAGEGVCEMRPFYGAGFAASEGKQLYMSLWRPTTYGPPEPGCMTQMNELVERETRAGRLLSTGGLLPSETGSRVGRTAGRLTITDGPFAESKEVVSGFGVFEVASLQEAIDAARRFLEVVGEGECEVRPMFTA